jgi:hypothetical protein
MAKKVKSSLKPITYKFSSRKHGEVVFKGLNFDAETLEAEELPQELVKVLEGYGFDSDSPSEWFDVTSPMMGLEENLEYLTAIVPVIITSRLRRNKRGKKRAVFFVTLDKALTAEGKDIHEALLRAHKHWNLAGRPIEGKTFTWVMDATLGKVNRKRCIPKRRS